MIIVYKGYKYILQQDTLYNRDINTKKERKKTEYKIRLYVLILVQLLQTTLIDTKRSGHTNNVYLLCNFTLNRFLKVWRLCELLIRSWIVFHNLMPCTVIQLAFLVVRATTCLTSSSSSYNFSDALHMRSIMHCCWRGVRGCFNNFSGCYCKI